MAKYILGLLLVALMAFTACERPAPPTTDGVAGGYNLTLYLQQQTERLKAEKPMVLKSVSTIGEATETIETDAINWEDELAVFEQLDLRRPALEEYYKKQEFVLENGDIAIEYKKLPDSKTLVNYLYITLNPNRKLKQLNATLLDKNPLFYSNKKVQLNAESNTGNISGYTIQGVQKLIFSDSLHYKVSTNL
jgi:hypothetical protein